jgi:hypothetical protein
MTTGIEKFEYFLEKFESLVYEASKDENPGRFLYSHDGRTPLFMLEGLSRLYSKLHNKGKFEKIKDHFKAIEDMLGAIDYYDVYTKNYQNNASIPDSIKSYMTDHRELMFYKLNQFLVEHGWLGDKPNRFKKIRKILWEIDWISQKKEIKKIKEIYISDIDSIKKFIKKNGNPFTEMELQVHEVRRDLRWLSIYPHALQGQIQYAKESGSEIQTASYLTSDILSSKYNQFPDVGNNSWVLLLEKNYFYSLSWLIAEIGKLKDLGLEYFALVEAFQETEHLPKLDAEKKALEVLGWDDSKLASLLSSASSMTNAFLSLGLFDQLVYGISLIKKHKG